MVIRLIPFSVKLYCAKFQENKNRITVDINGKNAYFISRIELQNKRFFFQSGQP
jgi:hypothetical protein